MNNLFFERLTTVAAMSLTLLLLSNCSPANNSFSGTESQKVEAASVGGESLGSNQAYAGMPLNQMLDMVELESMIQDAKKNGSSSSYSSNGSSVVLINSTVVNEGTSSVSNSVLSQHSCGSTSSCPYVQSPQKVWVCHHPANKPGTKRNICVTLEEVADYVDENPDNQDYLGRCTQ